MADSLGMDNLTLSETDSKRKRNAIPPPLQQQPPKTPANRSTAATPRTNGASNDEESARDAALNAELESLRRINEVVEGVIASLDRAKANMDVSANDSWCLRGYHLLELTRLIQSLQTVTRTVNHASTLLDTWTRILNQTEHNQRLILNPAWQGASQDLADAEQEGLARRRERERLEAEEAARKEARKLEEDRRRMEAERPAETAATGAVRGGRGTGTTRGPPGYGRAGVGGIARGAGGRRVASSGYGRGTVSGIGRGGVGRGRGRGIS